MTDLRSRRDRIGAAIFGALGAALVVAVIVALVALGIYREWRIWR